MVDADDFKINPQSFNFHFCTFIIGTIYDRVCNDPLVAINLFISSVAYRNVQILNTLFVMSVSFYCSV